jgi:hypothetical protein
VDISGVEPVRRIESPDSTDGNPNNVFELLSFSGVNGRHTETVQFPNGVGFVTLPCNVSWLHREWVATEDAYAVYSFTVDRFTVDYALACLQDDTYGFLGLEVKLGGVSRAEIVFDPTGGNIGLPPTDTYSMVAGSVFRFFRTLPLPMGTRVPNTVSGTAAWAGPGSVWSLGRGTGTVVGVSGNCLETPPVTRVAVRCDGADEIVVDLEGNTDAKPTAKHLGHLYVPGDTPGPDPVGVVWTSELCDTEPTYPVLALCLDPSTTILADDASRAGEPRAVFAGELWRDTGGRATGDPEPVVWTDDPCPVPPVYRLCGDAPGVDGVQSAFRSRVANDTTPVYFFNDVFPVSGEPNCQERWVLYYERVEDDGGAYPLLPEGALGGQGGCQPPSRLGPKTCVEGGGIIPPPDYGPPVGGENPAGRSPGSARGLPPGYDPTVEQIKHHTCKGCGG